MTIKVLVCDDSPLMRAMLSEVINQAPDMKVVGTAMDPIQARDRIKELNPDVLTLDVEMPRMSGLEFLERLMRLRPMPVVMISTLTQEGSETTLRALELGAVEFLAKPKIELGKGLEAYAHEICEKIRTARHARVRRLSPVIAHSSSIEKRQQVSSAAHLSGLPPRLQQEHLIAIGASTGGTEAIREVLSALPAHSPPIVIVQHMPEMFTGSFAKRLDNLCHISVKEAEDGERVRPGVAYLAPGHSHLSIRRSGGGWVCELSKSEPVNRHRPAVDVLFHSVAKEAGAQALGVILTGMGKDGALGMLAMRQAGAWTVAQDQDSCVVYGMPREADAIGAAVDVAPLKDIASRVWHRLLAGGDRRSA
ncbi:MAG: chemotaxis response regulator protein-glutamate methylesterase [Zoogloeaceae bacterium]|nr:chemotaxis response regulator protein-glutamate methylesterase [Zoogloeaceae bacterium]